MSTEPQKMAMPDLKQVILVRNDLNMSPGKAAAQVGHAAILFMVQGVHDAADNQKFVTPLMREIQWMFGNGPIPHQAGQAIAYGGMKKIVLGVDDLTHLWALHWEAKDAGLKVFNVFDEGVNDITACAIGPDYSETIDKVTGDLNLYGPPLAWKEEAQPLKALHGLDLEKFLDRQFETFGFGNVRGPQDRLPRPNEWSVAITPKKRFRY